MFCFIKKQREDVDAIIREINELNEKFVKEGVNLILRVKFGLK